MRWSPHSLLFERANVPLQASRPKRHAMSPHTTVRLSERQFNGQSSSQSHGNCLRRRVAARALGEVLGERLSLVDGLLLALGVVRVDYGRLWVTGGLTAAEALAAVHGDLRHGQLGALGNRCHEGRGERNKHGNNKEAEHD